ncbi:MAG: DUF2058 family protein [Proteobacteria bacterium]|nr:DUF2058 family protein [Pseudomonadota bacterium]MBS0463800.1 DUF2058 family protein [Pseudomonadota bacterium]
MTHSMKDLLLGLGFKPSAKVEPKPTARTGGRAAGARGDDARTDGRRGAAPAPPKHGPGRGDGGKRGAAMAGEQGMALAKAYALRAQQEKDERIAAEKARQDAARIKREAKAKVVAVLAGQVRNDAAAELVRHFDYNGKIRRVHVTAEQLKALNTGALGVVQLDGSYLLVDADIARQVLALLPSLLALLVDPDAAPDDDPYADPKYAIPDDLTW